MRAGVEEHVRSAMQRAEELEAELEAVKKQHQEQLQVRRWGYLQQGSQHW